MAAVVIYIFVSVLSMCLNWFNQVLDATGMRGIWFSALVVFASYKFILAPVFGMAHSDTVKKSYNAFRRKKEE